MRQFARTQSAFRTAPHDTEPHQPRPDRNAPSRLSPMIDLSFNYPSTGDQELLVQRYMDRVLTDPALDLAAPRPYFGDPSDVESIQAAIIGSEAICEESALALVCSGQAALSAAIAAICVRPGMRFAAEPWNFPQFIGALPRFGASAVSVEMDESGMLPDALERVCQSQKLDAIYTMPNFHNPLGIVMAVDRREVIAEIARRHDLYVIEDDAYAFLEAEVRSSIRSFAPERTLQVFSLSKMVSLSLRLGAVVVPDGLVARAVLAPA
jgi:DNA-binding transcriptional MocR family regulator